jgi:hypothetical protein
MRLHDEGPHRAGNATGAEVSGQPIHLHHSAGVRPESVTVADIFRRYAVLDLAAVGVRPAGRLTWTPPDPPPREEPLAIARRRELARRRVAGLEHRWAQLRQARRYWTEAA